MNLADILSYKLWAVSEAVRCGHKAKKPLGYENIQTERQLYASLDVECILPVVALSSTPYSNELFLKIKF